MSAPTRQSTIAAILHMSIWRPSLNVIRGQVYTAFEGAEDHTSNFSARTTDIEELALFYDDMHNAEKVDRQLFYCVLDSVTQYENRLF